MVDTTGPPQEVVKEESLIMPSLPEEIIVDILSLLPVKSIIRCRCVCKNLCNKLFKDPKFVKMHLNHSIRNNKFMSLLKRSYRPMYSVNLCSSSAHDNECVVQIDSPLSIEDFFYRTYGSSNGLILLPNPWEYGAAVILWNPSTKEIKEIPEPSYGLVMQISPNASGIVYGFGYCPKLDDYKIVRAEMSYKDTDWVCDGCEVNVYSLASNSWKTIPYVIPYDFDLGGKAIKPVCYNGALHWIGSSCVSLSKGRELSIAVSIVMISFDFEKDTFAEIPLTLELQESLCYDHRTIHQLGLLSHDIRLGSFNECLSLVQGEELDSARNNNVDIWVMKEYGVKESWTKMFSVSTQSMERSVKYSLLEVKDFRNGMIIFLKDRSSLVLYDPKHETARVVNTCGLSIEEGWSYVDTYVESLVSLNSGIFLCESVLKSRQRDFV